MDKETSYKPSGDVKTVVTIIDDSVSAVNSFTVAELIESLKRFPLDMKVVYDYDGGYDALPIENVEPGIWRHRYNDIPVVVIK